ncbi:DNA replication/repair protein RecF [Anaerostipes faecalis]|uniref:DNA replication/repair protein RecF n=1 Tax=Anaerostipes faecalis TaxID=2738446 RepID=UPI001C1E59E7|nr:DNA replication/repair protein RecF [Anaerostipes faecalis]
MYIKSLELKNYRNYENLSIDFANGTNLLYGDNAQGKTNILEAVYLGATTKSHRGSKDREIIRFKENESHIRMHYEKQDIMHQLDMHLKRSKAKGVAIDKIPIRKSSDLLGQIPIIFFSPEDLKIIKNGPSERRKFLDIELSQLESLYLYHLSKYNKILVQRNNLLKQINFQKSLIDTLEAWDIQLVKYGSEIVRYREAFIKHLNVIIKEIHGKLTGNKEEIRLEYDNNVNYDEFLTELIKKRNIDLKYSTTTVGPHRDDISFIVNDIDIRKYGSQGQQRTAALSLKLAQIQLVKEVMKDSPVLLLDDVLSELDSHRKKYLLESIKDTQTMITCTGLDEFIDKHLPIQRMFQIRAGKIVKQN